MLQNHNPRRLTWCLCSTAAALLAGCGGGGSSSGPSSPPINLTRATEGATADNTFGFKLLSEIESTAPAGSNVVISPVSISQMLMLAYNGAGAQTATQIGNALGYENIPLQQADLDTQSVVNSLTSADQAVRIVIANSAWIQSGWTFNSTYQSYCRQYLNARIGSLDFTNPSTAAQTINDWTDTNTNGGIPTIVTPTQINNAVFVLANAVYFHGTWSYNYFNPSQTKPGAFTLSNGSTEQVPLMTYEGVLKYASNSVAQAVEIPYGSGRLYLLVLLPSSGKTVTDVLDALSAGGVTPWTSRMTQQDVGLLLPKFSLTYVDQTMPKDLEALGIVSAFTNADFVPMGVPPGTNLTQVLFESTFDVDETGTTATAGTLGIGGTDVFGMSVTQPFVCAICDSETGATLFAGSSTL